MKLQRISPGTGAARTALAVSLLVLTMAAVEPAFSRGIETKNKAAGGGGAAYAGVWKAEYHGKTFALLKLKIEDTN